MPTRQASPSPRGIRAAVPGVFQLEVSPLGAGIVGLRLAVPGGVLSTNTLHVVEPPPPGVDADGDGLPDAWELRHGLDPRVLSARSSRHSSPC